MQLEHVTWQGDQIDDPEILPQLPPNLADLLGQINGFILYQGGFHLFGACTQPAWHSIRENWHGEQAAWHHYPNILETDVPFAEDCLGFQFLLRDDLVIFLDGQTGDVQELGVGLGSFLNSIPANPLEAIGLAPLLQYMKDGNQLQPGELLAEYPFFFTKQARDGVELSKSPSADKKKLLIHIYSKLKDAKDGEPLTFSIERRAPNSKPIKPKRKRKK
ncbi:MAG: hypothetical protein ACI9EW_002374 [Cellvibrionaceae bacterium]|jgi:hypothetical protein